MSERICYFTKECALYLNQKKKNRSDVYGSEMAYKLCKIETETGRHPYDNLLISNRIRDLCNSNEIEDEYLVVLTYPCVLI